MQGRNINVMRTFYEILGISNNATQEEILTAYRKKVIENHPDRGGNAIEFMNTRKAYETLSDPVVRKKYDQWIINKISEQNKQRLNIYLNNFIRQICTDEILVSQLNHMLSDYNNTWIYKDLNKIPSNEDAAELVKKMLNAIRTIHPELKAQCLELDSTCNNIILGKYSHINNNNGQHAKENEYKQKDIPDSGCSIYPAVIVIIIFFILGLALIFMNAPKNTTNVNGDTATDESIATTDSERQSNYQNYDVTNFDTGATPYEDYFGYGQFDDESLSELTISNNSSTDAVVLLETLDGDVVRNNFINTGDVFTMKQIPSCTCKVKVMFGNSWNSNKNNGSNFPIGGFMDNISFIEADDIFFFNALIENNRIKYPTYSITLDKVENGNMQTTPISQDSFFN